MKQQKARKYDKENAFTVKVSQQPASTMMGEYLTEYLTVTLSVFAALFTLEYVLKVGIGSYYSTIVPTLFPILLILSGVIFSGLAVYMFNKPKRMVQLIYGLSALLVVVLCLYWVLPTAQVLSEAIAVSTYKWFSIDLPVLGVYERITFAQLGTAVPIAFIVFSFCLSVLFSVAVIRVRRLWLFVLFLLPFFWLAANYDAQPNDFCIGLILLSLAAMIPFSIARIRGKRKGKQKKSMVRPAGPSLAFVSAGVAAIILFSIAVPRAAYTHPEVFSASASNPFESFWQLFTHSNSGMSGGKLGDIQTLTRNGASHLEVTGLTEKDTVYLKGYTGSVYTGRSFETLPENQYTKNLDGFPHSLRDKQDALWEEYNHTPLDLFEPFWRNGLTDIMGGSAEENKRTITVKRTGADSRYTYVPYYAYAMDGAHTFSKDQVYYDTGVVPNRSGEWTFSMYAFPDDQFGNVVRKMSLNDERHLLQERADLRLNGAEPYVDYVTFYQSFAKQMYTALPSDGRFDWMNDLFWDNMSLKDIIDVVKQTVQDGTTYSLTPGATPQDQDFVNHFLLENKKGFCMHYAAAAVMLFRAAGVPARYAEGYVVTSNDVKNAKNGVAVIRDTNAHAWAEIYFEPLGWIPIEVTPGFSSSSIAAVPDEEASDNSAESSEESDETAVESSEAESSEEESVLESSASESSALESENSQSDSLISSAPESGDQTLTSGGASFGQNGQISISRMPSWILIAAGGVLFVILLCLCLWWARTIHLRRRRQILYSGDRNRAACAAYTECLSLLSMIGMKKEPFEDDHAFAARVDRSALAGIMFEEITKIAECARFSGVQISEEERAQMIVCVRRLERYVSAHLSPFLKIRYWMRYPL